MAMLTAVTLMLGSSVVWYVSPRGSDSNSGRSAKASFATLQKAGDACGPGDVIRLAPGRYVLKKGQVHLTLQKSGEPTKPITIQGDPTGGTVLVNDEAWHAIEIKSARHVVIQDLVVVGNGPLIPLTEARREMSNLTNPRTCGNGISIVGTAEKPAANVTVRRCRVDGIPGGGINSMHADYLTITDNHVTRCGFTSPYANSGISVYQPYDVDENTGVKIRIERNLSTDNRNFVPFYYSNPNEPDKREITDGNGIILDDFRATQSFVGKSGKGYGGKAVVANNIVLDNGGSGIHVYLTTGVSILHNWAEGNNRTPTQRNGQIFANTAEDVRIFGNVMIAAPGKPVTSGWNNKPSVEVRNNVYWSEDRKAPVSEPYTKDNWTVDPGARLELSNALPLLRARASVRFETDSPLLKSIPRQPEAMEDYLRRPRAKLTTIGPWERPIRDR